MNREEAIIEIQDRMKFMKEHYPDDVPDYYEALELAKDALESEMWWCPDIKLPNNNRYILLAFENFENIMIGRYELDEEGGAFYIGDSDKSCVSELLLVEAWRELPERYEQNNKVRRIDLIRNMPIKDLGRLLMCPYEDAETMPCANRCDVKQEECDNCIKAWLEEEL